VPSQLSIGTERANLKEGSRASDQIEHSGGNRRHDTQDQNAGLQKDFDWRFVMEALRSGLLRTTQTFDEI